MSLLKESINPSPITKFIDSLRKRLIDQSGRNSLINFRFRQGSRSSLEIATKNLNQIWQRVYKDEASLELMPISEEVNLKDKKQQGLFDKREKTREIISLTEEEIEKLASDDKFVVNLEKQKFQSNCNNVKRKAEGFIKETGINNLYLSIGYLKWFESQDSEKERKSPLILIPISISCSSKPGMSEKKYELKYFDEEIEQNTSLKVTLESQFGLTLPFINDEETIEVYFKRLKALIRNYSGWEIEHQSHVGFFSFTKLRMYEDLNSSNWPDDKALEDNVLIQSILEGSQKSEGEAIYGDNEVHDEHKAAHKIPLVMEADSSQHTAILKVAEGLNTVIEGPPGTGKSQTITNIIGNAIYSGKSVLFVSEKQAALNVVKENLERAGLSEFCLELHSSKANRQEVFHSLEKRIRNRNYEPQGLHETQENWESCVVRLLAYIRKCSAKEGFLETELYNYFFKAFVLREQKIGSLRHKIKSPLKNRQEYIRCLNILQSITDRFKNSKVITQSKWKLFKITNFNPGDEIYVIPKIQQIKNIVKQIQDQEKYLKEIVTPEICLKIYKEPQELEGDQIFDKLAANDEETLKILSNYECLNELAENCKTIQNIEAVINKTESTFSKDTLKNDENVQNIQAISKQLCEMGLGTASQQEIFRQIPFLSEVEKEIEEIFNEIKEYEQKNIVSVRTLNDVKEALPLLSKISEVPHFNQEEISKEIFFPSCIERIRQAKNQQEKTLGHITEAQKNLYLDNLDLETTKILYQTFKKYLNNPFSFIFKEYRTAKSQITKVCRSDKPSKKNITEYLEKAISAFELRNEFLNNNLLNSIFGRQVELKDDLGLLLSTAEWALELANEGILLENINLIYKEKNPLKYRQKEQKISQSLKIVQQRILECDQLLNAFLGGHSVNDYEIKALPKYFQELIAWLRNSIEVLEKGSSKRLTANETYHAANEYLHAKTELRKIIENKKTGHLFKDKPNIIDQTKKIQEAVSRVLQLSLAVPFEMISCLLANESKKNLETFKKVYPHINKNRQELQNAIKEIAPFGSIMMDNEASKKLEVHEIHKKINTFLEDPSGLADWAFFSKTLNEAADSDAALFIQESLNEKLEFQDLPKAFELSHIEFYAYKKLSENKDLEGFASESHDSLRDKFKVIDKKLLSLNREFLAYKISKNPIPIGVTKGAARERTERGLIEHEISKSRKHIPIRELMKRAGRAVRSLKPCVMMSPLSVAQYLDTSLDPFDLVVMDEASQIKPEDALGAIARGKQLVVVGDTKQMPPSSFYQTTFDEDLETDDISTAEDSESVLECGLHSFAPVYRLKWHYRSRHENLIKFSNYYYYDNELVIFPSTGTDGKKLGISFNYIEEATFQGRQNIKEAEAVAKAAINHCINNPSESLMIVTMNIPQQDLIESILDRLTENDPVARKAVEEASMKNEEFTVKNLENIQGHQRDVVFISMTYGKDPDSKKVMQRFGPINGKSGRRRLNVLFTRAKNRNEIFSSMKYSDILGSIGQESGVNDLRNYLNFAETGILADEGKITGIGPDSEFEESVIRVIRSTGLIATPQIGVGGFRIDIGVSKQENPDRYILGIECDGASYHSSKSARDRDRLREEALVARGWRIFRIWSTDWFYRHENAKQRLLNVLSDIVKQ